MVRLHILFPFQDGPSGGGNRFLTALRQTLRAGGHYAEAPEDADIFLFNSHHDLHQVFHVKALFPDKPFLHRIDGPMSAYRGQNDRRDSLVALARNSVADGAVYQSHWSQEGNRAAGARPLAFEAVIGNAPDPALFHTSDTERPSAADGRFRLTATSWSANVHKGFDIYASLDRNLDFSRFDMTFIGNSPIAFNNIRMVPPQAPHALAAAYRNCDAFITASENDPCSNALLEALHAGLPAAARRSGGHPEIVGNGGVLFDGTADVLDALERLQSDASAFRAAIRLPDLSEIASLYLHFAREVLEAVRQQRIRPKRLGRPARFFAFRRLRQLEKSMAQN
ncbi:MAG: glycosyltransferase [Rhodospirillales bacterium]